LVSAIAAVKNSTSPSGCHSHNQLSGCDADIEVDAPCVTMKPGSRLPTMRNEPMSEMPIATSYDIICDELRRPPSSAHLL
jgi:hypothetical protein